MAISAADVKKLREATGAPMLDCKTALEQHNGDFDKAIEWLKEKGLAKAAKKADRATKEGRVEVYLHPGNRVAVMVEVNCETDFVAKTDAFQAFAHEVALHIAMAAPKYVDVADIPAADLEAKKAEMKQEALAEGKLEHVAEKIVEGKLDKYYAEVCLLRQPFVKDEDKTIGVMLKEAIAAIGENMAIRRFTRYQLGE
ncbi:MAG TPA: translation elongation factor Ts [Anaerolineales bacterium]|nr:translation elongation factor Ts [Anaerolineales bacterium]